MTITISLPPETEEKLLKRAADSGLAPAAYARKLIEQGLDRGAAIVPADQAVPRRPGDTKLEEILGPFRAEVEESGMTDDEMREFFTEVREEARAAKRAKQS